MAFDVVKWDERILKDYRHIASTFHSKWKRNRDVMNNENAGSRWGNLSKEFAGAIRSRLINRNFFVSVSADDPDFAKNAREMTVMANSVSRTVDLKETLDEATENSLWAGTGWLEVGHTLDLHSFDPMRTVLHNGPNAFDAEDLRDEFVPVSEDEVRADVGNEITNIAPFDPFQRPEIQESPQPKLTFDPDVGAPWINTVSPFFVVLPKETKKFSEADYVTKLVVISRQELEFMIPDLDIPDNVGLDKTDMDILLDETPGGEYIDEPVIVAVTFIRRDRNDPEFSGWYLAHVLGSPDVVIKSASNPYGGMISLIPAKSRASMRVLAKSWVEDLQPYTDEHSKILEAAFRRIKYSLAIKWSPSGGTEINKRNAKNLSNPGYNGKISFEGASSEVIYHEGPGLTQDIMAAINLASKLAQGEAGQTDIDRGTAVKKITARQTQALLDSSLLMMEAIRGPIVNAGNQAVLKLIHLLNLFSTPREHIFRFGPHIVSIEPGGNDFTTSYEYKIEVKDLEGPANAETQLLIVQFLQRIAVLPQFQDKYNWLELANEARRAFGFGVETMAQLQTPVMPGENSSGGPGGGVLPFNQGGGHDARLPGDQGSPGAASIANQLGALSRT